MPMRRLTAAIPRPKIDLLTIPGGDPVEDRWSPRGVLMETRWNAGGVTRYIG